MVADTAFASYRGVAYIPSHSRDVLSFIAGLPAPNTPPPRSPKRPRTPVQTTALSKPQSTQRKHQVAEPRLHKRQTLFWHPALGMIDEDAEELEETDWFIPASFISSPSSRASMRSDSDRSYQQDVDVDVIPRSYEGKSGGKSSLQRSLSIGYPSSSPHPASGCARDATGSSLKRSWSLRSRPRRRTINDDNHEDTNSDTTECVGHPYSEAICAAPPSFSLRRQSSVKSLLGRLRDSALA
jgi:hypothetical protein